MTVPNLEQQGMPDVAAQAPPRRAGTLDRVGMHKVEVPVRLRDERGQSVLVPARANVAVSLDDPSARGIHMSRLFLALQSILAEQELGLPAIRQLLETFVTSHAAISTSSSIRLDFELPVMRPALVTDNAAWRQYPVWISGELAHGRVSAQMGVTVAYSSTCPCSAALARQLIQERFRQDFSGTPLISADDVHAWLGQEESIAATPHSQRSYAHLAVELRDTQHAPEFIELIDRAEYALKTPVQAAVKREDEQEFARLNAANLMFCEDAARRLKQALDADCRIADYRIEAVHVESLHPHDAVAIAVKGIPGGFRA
jgi:GTP cyclohydrolase IB